jgi:hypothetical protein
MGARKLSMEEGCKISEVQEAHSHCGLEGQVVPVALAGKVEECRRGCGR